MEDYKEKIVEIVKNIDNEKLLRYIWIILVDLTGLDKRRELGHNDVSEEK